VSTAKRALGKGLEALLPQRRVEAVVPAIAAGGASEGAAAERAAAVKAAAEGAAGKPLEIALDAIERNPFQTRTHFDEEKLGELAQSIAASGVVQPIVVRKLPIAYPSTEQRYQLITGERRWLASRKAGKTTIPSIVRAVSDAEAMEMTVVENLQRADLNPMEQARAYHRLSGEFHLTQEQMATRTGKDRASVANFLRLLKLPEAVQAKVEAGELSFGHARALLALESPESITSAAQKVMALHLSVRGTENYISGLLHPEQKPKPGARPAQPEDPNVREAQDQLRRALGLKVTIEDKRGKGKVIIEYAGVEDFDRLLEALG
jgi:ParB family chromosome partitioning protein